MSDATLHQSLVLYYQLLRLHGLNDSHSGNASAREGEHYFITKTGACADTLFESDIIQCELDGPPTASASLDASIHQRIYQQHPTSKAVLHAHNPYTIALTLNAKLFTPGRF